LAIAAVAVLITTVANAIKNMIAKQEQQQLEINSIIKCEHIYN
jgi:hypothetical protein